MALHQMLSTLIDVLHSSLCLAALDSPQLKEALIGTWRLAMSRKPFSIHAQIDCALYEDLPNP